MPAICGLAGQAVSRQPDRGAVADLPQYEKLGDPERLADRQALPWAVPAREAYEEAGLEEHILSETPIGHYRYDKQRDNGRVVRVTVGVFLMRVSRQLATWPEQA